MSFDLEMALIVATAVTGAVWLGDILWRRRRRGQVEEPSSTSPSKREPWFVEYAKAFFPVLLAVFLLRSFVAEPFRIPSGSMMPDLLVGDFILVNKFDYGLKLPITHTPFLPVGHPQRGDVVVFHFPEKSAQTYCANNLICSMEGGMTEVRGSAGEDYIKRLVGLPGDHICFQDNNLYINGKKVKRTYLGKYRGEGPNHFMGGAQEWLESLPRKNGTVLKHKILIIPSMPAPNGCVTVPPHHYFMMGDNRDYSFDSRYWGFVPARNFVGRAFLVWFNWDFRDHHIDWHRIGRGVN